MRASVSADGPKSAPAQSVACAVFHNDAMAKSPFTAPLSQIEFADIVAFCEQGLPESINLDYKLQITAPEKLAKTVSSFANTFGGLIVLGVDEDSASKPKPPFEGLQFEPKLEERVWSILMEHVYPPAFPEVHVCAPENARTFVLIRVAQSATTPHAIRHNTAVYLRTGNISKPELLERLATTDEISWLRERRRLSDELKNRITGRFDERFEALRRLRGLKTDKSRLHVWFGPKFPVLPLVSVEELAELRRSLKLHADRSSDDIPVHEGLVRAYVSKDDVDTLTETNVFGFTFEAAQLHAMMNTDLKLVFLSLIIDTITDVARFGQRFLSKLGYWGVCEFNVSVRGVLGMSLRPFGDMYFMYPKTQLDDRVDLSRDVPSSTWTDDEHLADVIVQSAIAIAWSFGWQIKADAVKQYLAKECAAWRTSG